MARSRLILRRVLTPKPVDAPAIAAIATKPIWVMFCAIRTGGSFYSVRMGKVQLMNKRTITEANYPWGTGVACAHFESTDRVQARALEDLTDGARTAWEVAHG